MIVDKASAAMKGFACYLSTSSMYFLVIHSLEVSLMGARLVDLADVGTGVVSDWKVARCRAWTPLSTNLFLIVSLPLLKIDFSWLASRMVLASLSFSFYTVRFRQKLSLSFPVLTLRKVFAMTSVEFLNVRIYDRAGPWSNSIVINGSHFFWNDVWSPLKMAGF